MVACHHAWQFKKFPEFLKEVPSTILLSQSYVGMVESGRVMSDEWWNIEVDIINNNKIIMFIIHQNIKYSFVGHCPKWWLISKQQPSWNSSPSFSSVSPRRFPSLLTVVVLALTNVCRFRRVSEPSCVIRKFLRLLILRLLKHRLQFQKRKIWMATQMSCYQGRRGSRDFSTIGSLGSSQDLLDSLRKVLLSTILNTPNCPLRKYCAFLSGERWLWTLQSLTHTALCYLTDTFLPYLVWCF